jgi:hypothetical protein
MIRGTMQPCSGQCRQCGLSALAGTWVAHLLIGRTTDAVLLL